ncbi:MAG: hypothetical protein JKY96_00365 [Phycisphaerales bacterium]|nr:hypothetical protein [Phycisphaerales bacterium]
MRRIHRPVVFAQWARTKGTFFMSKDPIDQLNVLQSAIGGRGSKSPAPKYGQSPGGDACPAGGPVGMGHTPTGQQSGMAANPAARVLVRRDVFWNNVVRDILMAMATAATNSTGRLSPTVTGAQASPEPIDNMFDGRVGVITTLGQRIPIADIYPVFSCSSVVPGVDRSLATDVQCTIFRIKTPTGESYTLPISQISGVHSLSDELVQELERAAEEGSGVDQDHIEGAPFGFGAYTALARAEKAEILGEVAESENSDPDSE